MDVYLITTVRTYRVFNEYGHEYNVERITESQDDRFKVYSKDGQEVENAELFVALASAVTESGL